LNFDFCFSISEFENAERSIAAVVVVIDFERWFRSYYWKVFTKQDETGYISAVALLCE